MEKHSINSKLVINSDQAMTLPRISTAPASPVNGDMYYNTTANKVQVYTAGAWQDVAIGNVSLTGQILGENEVIIGDSSGASASVDTDTVGDILADSVLGLKIKNNAVTDALIAAEANITRSKIAAGTPNRLVVNDGITGKLVDLPAITASRVLVSDANGLPVASTTTPADLANVEGTTGPIQTQLDNITTNFIPLTQKGAALGVATLDGGGKIPAAQLPSSVMTYEGVWNASTNTPTLADGTGDAGMVYLVTAAGTQDLGSGPITFAIGDWAVYSGTVWQKSLNSSAVVSVNTKTGVVVLTTDDISEGSSNLYFSDERAQDAVGAILQAGAKVSLTYDDVANTISATIVAGSLVDADISSSAAIALSKLAALTASRALVSNGSGQIAVATTTATEIGYVNGVTSPIQAQLDNKQVKEVALPVTLAASTNIATTTGLTMLSSVAKTAVIQYEVIHPTSGESRSGFLTVAAGNIAAGSVSLSDTGTSTDPTMDTVRFTATLNTGTGAWAILYTNPESVSFAMKAIVRPILV